MTGRRESGQLAAGLLLGLFALALLARIAVFELGQDRPNRDEVAYIELAAGWAGSGELARGGKPETHIAPLFPALHALAIRLGAPPQTGGRYLALLLSALVVPAAMWASRPILGHKAAIGAALLVGLHPRLLKTAEWIQPEHMTAALWLVFGGLLWRRRRRSAAAVLAVAFLGRGEALLLLGIWWLYELTVEKGAWRRMTLPTVIVAVLILPYLVFLRTTTGEWVLSGKADWVYRQAQIEVESDRLPVSREELDRLVDDSLPLWAHLRSEPAEFVRGYGRRLYYAFDHLKNALGWPLFIVAWLGVGSHLWRRREVARLYMPLSLLLLIPVVVVHARHVLPYVPTLLVAAVAALQSAMNLAAGRVKARMGR